jgi:uroporphyrinogen III methyltransferase / synthase
LPEPSQPHFRSPLAGKRIVVTRAREQAEDFCRSLEALGAQPILIPAIEIRDPESWAPLDDALRRLEEFDYLLVTSANGVRKMLGRLRACQRDPAELKRLTLGAIGPATAAELTRAGLQVDFVPREYRAEGLLEALAGREVRGKSFLIPRAKVARDLVPRVLAERGARVEVVEAYQTSAPAFAPGELHRLLTPRPDAITFTSSSTATHFARLLGERPLRAVLEGVAIASIGPVTSDTLRRLGLTVSVQAAESTLPGVVQALENYYRNPPS